jgi:predicted metal-dependent hydrolase
MSTKSHRIIVSDIPVDVVRKKIKNLHLAVYPPEGRVRVAAPLRVNDEAVRLAVISRLGWIRKQQAKFLGQERQSEREYLSGESHYFQGRRYRLTVIYHDAPPKVTVGVGGMQLHVRTGSNRDHREVVLQEWYRQQLKEQIPDLLAKWEEIIGVRTEAWGVKRMKTKWGTCNIAARRIWLNLELAKKPVHCLEYLIVHELVHLLERLHNDRFKALMDQFLPQWRVYKEELNHTPLGHEEWEC